MKKVMVFVVMSVLALASSLAAAGDNLAFKVVVRGGPTSATEDVSITTTLGREGVVARKRTTYKNDVSVIFSEPGKPAAVQNTLRPVAVGWNARLTPTSIESDGAVVAFVEAESELPVQLGENVELRKFVIARQVVTLRNGEPATFKFGDQFAMEFSLQNQSAVLSLAE